MEQIPLALIFYDGVVGGPTHNGLQDNTAKGEWSVRIVTHSIAEIVAVTRGITEIVLDRKSVV